MIQVITSTIDYICKPELKLDPIGLQLEFSRNKNFFCFTILMILANSLINLIYPCPAASHVYHVLLMIGILIMFSFCARTRITLFDQCLEITLALYGLSVFFFTQNFGISILGSATTIPTISLMRSRKRLVFSVLVLIQLAYLHVLSTPFLENLVSSLTNKELSALLIRYQSISLINILILCWVYREPPSKELLKRTNTFQMKEHKKEKQRLFLLYFSHVLRNPLNSILGNLQLALLNDLPANIREKLNICKVCGEVLLSQINNILDKGKVEVGDLEVIPTPTKVFDHLQKIWGVCAELIKERGLQGSIIIDKSLPKILILDNSRLTQILLNLVGNAVKTTEKGSISLTVQWIRGPHFVNERCFQPYPYGESGIF